MALPVRHVGVWAQAEQNGSTQRKRALTKPADKESERSGQQAAATLDNFSDFAGAYAQVYYYGGIEHGMLFEIEWDLEIEGDEVGGAGDGTCAP